MASEAQLNTLQQLYIAYFGRPAEPSGVTYWEGRIDAGMSLDDVANAFTTADEFVAAYGDDTAALVRAAYENALGREVESEEALNFWVNQLDSGAVTPADLMNSFFGTSDATDLAVLNNRTEVAKAYTAAAGANYDAAASKTLLASVDDTQASVDAALEQVGGEAPVDNSELTEALVALQDAQTEEADALAAIALADNANEDDGEAVVVDDAATANVNELNNWVGAYTEVMAQAELARAETQVGTDEVALLNAQSALRADRNEVGTSATVTNGDYLDGDRLTDANLTAALNEIRGDIAATAGTATDVSALLNARTEAQSELAGDVAAEGTNRQIATELRAAIVAFAEAGGDLSAELVAGGDKVSDLLADVNAALAVQEDDAVGGVDELIGTIDTAAYTDLAPGPNGTGTAVNSAITVIEERDALEDAVVQAQASLTATSLGRDLADVEALIEARNEAIDLVAEEQEDLAASQQYFEELTALVEAYTSAGESVEDAAEALEALGVDNLVELAAASTAGTAGEGDLYLFSAENTGNVSLLNFEADDQLFIGEGFARVDLAATDALATQRLGDASVLEVFFQQVGANTVINIEGQAFAGNQLSTVDITSITLTGVSVEDVSFENGYVTVA